MSGDQPEVSVVLPVYRNRATVEELYVRLCRTLEDVTPAFELLFVDDACPEVSRDVLASLVARDRRVRAIILAENIGQHRAVLAGFDHVRGRHVVVMDADLQDPPEAVAELLGARDGDMGVVFAGRRGRYESRGRLVTSRIFKRTLGLVSGTPRDAGMFFVAGRRVVERVLELGWRRPFVVAMVAAVGSPVRSIPVERLPRPSGQSSYSAFGRMRSASRALAATALHRVTPARRHPSPGMNQPRVAAYLGEGFEDRQ